MLLTTQSHRSLAAILISTYRQGMASTYQERLATFKKWPHASPTPKGLAAAGFCHEPGTKDLTTCSECDLAMNGWQPHEDLLKEHYSRAPDCSFFNNEEAKEAAIEAKEAAAAAVIEAAKPEATNPKDIGFFDPTMPIDLWDEFRISANSASYLHRLAESAARYTEKSILEVLSQCLRGPARIWIKDQPKFTSLDDFKKAFITAFPATSASAASFDSVIVEPSPRYHTCPECAAQFSSISRLLAHTQKDCSNAFTCKHCEEAFASNNKLHEHVRLHHEKGYDNKTLGQRLAERGGSHIDFPNTPITSKISREAIATSPRTVAKPSRLPRPMSTAITAPTSPITAKSMAASAEPSYLSIPMAKAQAACPTTPPADPLRNLPRSFSQNWPP